MVCIHGFIILKCSIWIAIGLPRCRNIFLLKILSGIILGQPFLILFLCLSRIIHESKFPFCSGQLLIIRRCICSNLVQNTFFSCKCLFRIIIRNKLCLCALAIDSYGFNIIKPFFPCDVRLCSVLCKTDAILKIGFIEIQNLIIGLLCI